MDAPDQAKLFVGGISWDTNEETLRDHFRKYGDVVDSVIMKDRNTGSTRGFGFVLFSDSSASDKALRDKHVISGRTVSFSFNLTFLSLHSLFLFFVFPSPLFRQKEQHRFFFVFMYC